MHFIKKTSRQERSKSNQNEQRCILELLGIDDGLDEHLVNSSVSRNVEGLTTEIPLDILFSLQAAPIVFGLASLLELLPVKGFCAHTKFSAPDLDLGGVTIRYGGQEFIARHAVSLWQQSIDH